MSKVYKCDLLSIGDTIVVETDRSRRHNISKATVTPVETILVQDSLREGYFKEIITGTLIPTYRIERYQDFDDSPVVITEEVPRYGCYIKYTAYTSYERYDGDDLVLATADEVESYIKNNSKRELTSRLTSYFQNAESFYRNAESKGVKSDQYRVKKLLKALKNK